MTINKAIKELFNSEEFKIEQKQNATLRNNLSRYKKGELKTAAVIETLLHFGYIIDVKKPKKSIKGIK